MLGDSGQTRVGYSAQRIRLNEQYFLDVAPPG